MRREELAAGRFATDEVIVELPDGYSYRFAGADSQLEPLLGFIAAERHCCPFLTFEIAFQPLSGQLWLRLCGSPRVQC
jgi:hypothetical protein